MFALVATGYNISMSKKRRTKEQKQRAVSRRQQVRVAPISEVVESPTILETKQLDPIATAKTAQGKAYKLSGWNPYQRRSLRLSLWLLAALVSFQLLVWLLFHFTAIDTKLYELIKL